jgi:hypothetical protein
MLSFQHNHLWQLAATGRQDLRWLMPSLQCFFEHIFRVYDIVKALPKLSPHDVTRTPRKPSIANFQWLHNPHQTRSICDIELFGLKLAVSGPTTSFAIRTSLPLCRTRVGETGWVYDSHLHHCAVTIIFNFYFVIFILYFWQTFEKYLPAPVGQILFTHKYTGSEKRNHHVETI